MRRIVLASIGLLSGCDLLASATAVELELPAIKEGSISGPEQAPIEASLSASPLTPSFTLPDIDTNGWGPIIKAHLAMEAASQEGPFAIEIADLDYTGDPLHVSVIVSSKDGQVEGEEAMNPEITTPASCGFDIDSTITGELFGQQLTNCVLDWVSENGVPMQFDLEMLTGDLAGARAPAEYNVTASFAVQTKQSTVAACGTGMADGLKDQVKENIDKVTLSEMAFYGEGWSSKTVFVLGFGSIYDADGKLASSLFLAQGVAAGTKIWINGEIPNSSAPSTYTVGGTAAPIFFPEWPGYLTTSIDALAGKNTGGRGGSGRVCYVVTGEAPREGKIQAVFKAKAQIATN